MDELSLVEIVANPDEVLLNRVKEKAILWKLEAGVLYAVIQREDVKGLRGIVMQKELPKDIKELASVLAKYGIRMVCIAMVVDNRKKASIVIGKGGWKVKLLSKYLDNTPVKVLTQRG